MPIVVRTITYATLFIGIVLVFVPARVLERAGVETPAHFGAAQLAGAIVTLAGAALALWSIVSFVRFGRGTPAPFDPPTRLVTSGPFAWIRNPMYAGAGTALAGAALFYRSWALLGYAAAFFAVTHVFVRVHEEPALRRTFGAAYEAYCRRVGRWWPRRGARGDTG
jgi:protein-S-isoprenylcysteine O-methyltransferase Ste14